MKKKKINIIDNRFNILMLITFCLLGLIIVRLFNITIINHNVYLDKLHNYGISEIVGASAPRGKIYDRLGRVIVDNTGLKTIYYKKSNLSLKEEIELAYTLANHLEINYKITPKELKEYWILTNSAKANAKITSEEEQLLKQRKMSLEERKNLILERITQDEMAIYKELDQEAIYIYNLMNKGYSHQEKVIKDREVTDQEYIFIAENADKLKGVDIKLDWERYYPYGDTLRTILGNVSTSSTGIPYEYKDDYLKKGYSLNERVGLSYLEYQYEDYLKGENAVYKKQDGNIVKVKDSKSGNDLTLSIDIELQQEIENILKEEILSTKSEPNTEFYNKSMVILSDPRTGEIIALAGKQIMKVNNNYQFYDYTPSIITSPVTSGSIVKGASILTGYRYNAIQIGTTFYDKCIKLKGTNEKCSFKDGLGSLNDINALRWSSNSYQFQTALKVANIKYSYNMGATVDEEVFNKYRNTYHEFGLGVKTGIDLPNESSGYHGKNTTSVGLLLDYVIGQYEAYTPMQLMQYINTIANDGERLRPYLVKKITSNDATILENNRDVLNKIAVDLKYFKRIKDGFKSVMEGPLGYNYVNNAYRPAGKTGTAQTFVDSNNNGKIDTETLTNTVGIYAPYDNPVVSMVVVSPDYKNNTATNTYESNVNRRIARRVMDAYFKRYKSA